MTEAKAHLEEVRKSDSGSEIRNNPVLLVPLCLLCLAASFLFSRGFLEPDEITHYLYARASWHDWRNLVNIWGRLGCTGIYSLAAPAGIVAPRLLAVAVTALTAWGTAAALREVLHARASRIQINRSPSLSGMRRPGSGCCSLRSRALRSTVLP